MVAFVPMERMLLPLELITLYWEFLVSGLRMVVAESEKGVRPGICVCAWGQM